MRLALLSDVHLVGDPDDPADRALQAALVDWLDGLQVDRLCLLGDLFHHWWGRPGVVPAGLVPACAALLRLRGRGIALTVVPGNHDFALGPFFRDQLGAELRGPHRREVDGQVVFLAHGDEADASPGYRATRALLRGPAMAGLMRLLGPVRGDALLARLAGSSRHRPADPVALRAAQQRVAAAHMADGVDIVAMGHIHAPALLPLAGGTMVHLGGWGVDRTWCLIEGGVPRLLTGPCPEPARAP